MRRVAAAAVVLVGCEAAPPAVPHAAREALAPAPAVLAPPAIAPPTTTIAPPPDASTSAPPRAEPRVHGVARLGTVTMRGRLPQWVVAHQIEQGLARFRVCYLVRLKTEPTLGGELTVHFVIGTQGAVTRATVDEGATLADAGLRACAITTFMKMKFPPPEGGIVSGDAPLRLTPEP